ncbi:chromosome segregation Spc25 [Tubulinosema ratisbonensis]|uniref:Chromosome segregation Spc25 n=1 Tax=Tubulinosema ratisbonensis TaxID=291195 RepID=A0A437APR9_9MICR|nr:chromosome segregation Spc25 [Tubulinosema ratisbonensis]
MDESIKIIEELKDQIFERLDKYIDNLRKFSINCDSKFGPQKETLSNDIERISIELEDTSSRNKTLIEECAKISLYIKEDSEGLQKELTLIQEREPFLKEKGAKLEPIKEESERIARKLELINLVYSKREEEDKIWKEKCTLQAENFRKYLGIDIKPVVKHVLKVIFYLEEECYFLINFENNPKIIDLFPIVISIEEAQLEYKRLDDFYEFCKWIRKLFSENLILLRKENLNII